MREMVYSCERFSTSEATRVHAHPVSVLWYPVEVCRGGDQKRRQRHRGKRPRVSQKRGSSYKHSNEMDRNKEIAGTNFACTVAMDNKNMQTIQVVRINL